MKAVLLTICVCLLISCTTEEQSNLDNSTQNISQTQPADVTPASYHAQKATDKLFVIERDMPGVGGLSPLQLQEASQLSNNVLAKIGPEIKWIHSYVTDDKIYCVYSAPNKELIEQHARDTGFPANKISEAGTVIDPLTAGD